MKNRFIILTIITIVFCACGNRNQSTELHPTTQDEGVRQNSTLSYVDECENLNRFLQTYDKPVQQFQITGKNKSTVTGELGTVVHVDPSNLETYDGQPLGETIEVELKEYCNQRDLLRGNVATVSDGRLIISGGAYYLNMTSDGKPLKIKQGKNIEVEFPKFAEEEMELFYGQRDSTGQMNWRVAQQRFANRMLPVKPLELDSNLFSNQGIELLLNVEKVVFKSDYERKEDTLDAVGITQQELELLKKERIEQWATLKKNKEQEIELWKLKVEEAKTMYQSIQIIQLGWINCDRFFLIPNKTNLLIALDEPLNIRSANFYLVFKDINSLMSESYVYGGSLSFDNIPVDYNVRLIVIGSSGENKDEETYTYSSDFKIKKDEKRTIKLKKSSKKELDKILALEW